MKTALTRAQWQGYAAAVALSAVFTLLTLFFAPYLQSTPGVFFFLAVLGSAWYGGFGPGILASVLCVLAIDLLFIEPRGTLQVTEFTDAAGLLVFLATMVGVSALVASRKWIETQFKQRYAQVAALQRLSQAMARAPALDDVYTAALDNLQQTLGADRASILLIDPDGVMRFKAWQGLSDRYRAAVEGHSPWRPGTQNPQPVVIPDTEYAPDLSAVQDVIRQEGVRALAFIPLVDDGRLLGKFMLYYNRPYAPSASELSLAQAFASQVAVAVQRRQHEAKVRDERERLSVTLASIGDAVITTDATGHITFINPVAEALTEWPLAEAAGRPVAEVFRIINEDSRAPVESPVERVIRDGVMTGLANHTLLITRSGREVPIDDSGAPIRDTNGQLLGVVLVFRDITDRRQTEAALETRARQQAAVAELGQLALSEGDLGQLMEAVVNRVAQTLDVEYVKVLELLPDGQALLLRSGVGWQPGLVGHGTVGAGMDSQAGYTLMSDSPVIVSDLRTESRFSGPPLLHNHGVISGVSAIIRGREQPYGVLGAHTQRQRAFTVDDASFLQSVANVLANAIERASIEADLRLARDETTAILDNIAEGVTVQDRAGGLIYANDVAARVLGFASAEALLRTPVAEILQRFEIFSDTGEPFPLAQLPGRLALQGQRMPPVTLRFRVRATGEEHWSIVSAQPIYSAQRPGEIEYAVNVFHDVTGLKQAELAQRLLAEASGRLAGTLDYEHQLSGLARLAVPFLGDWCVICAHDQIEGGSFRPVTVVPADGSQTELAATWQQRLASPEALHDRSPITTVAHTGQPLVYNSGEAGSGAAEVPLARLHLPPGLELHSLMIVPLTAHGNTAGIMLLARAASPQRYTPSDLALAQELAHRAALAVENAQLYAAEQQARQQAEASQQRLAFLAETSTLLATSLDYPGILQRVVDLILPHMADCAAVFAREGDDQMRCVAAGHVDPAKRPLFDELLAQAPLRVDHPHGRVAQVLRTSQPLLEADFDLARLPQLPPETLAALHELGPRSVIIVPLVARGRALGAIALVSAESGHRYTPADLALAEELARRAALAADNARLYGEAQHLNTELEQRVQERTAELQATNTRLEREVAERQQAESRLRRSHEQLRALAKRLQSVREEEQRRIAREIHDELGGALTGLKMDLTRLRRHAEEDDTNSVLAKAEVMFRVIDNTIKAVRRIATELRPAVLDDFGLVAAIEWQLEEFKARAGIECVLHSNVDQIDLDQEAATAVFRVFQETLTNVARHAHADRVEVALERQSDSLLLQVRDNGRGIAESDIFGSRSLGLLGMRERVHLLAGEIDIRGAPGEGTLVLVRIPLQRQGRNRKERV